MDARIATTASRKVSFRQRLSKAFNFIKDDEIKLKEQLNLKIRAWKPEERLDMQSGFPAASMPTKLLSQTWMSGLNLNSRAWMPEERLRLSGRFPCAAATPSV